MNQPKIEHGNEATRVSGTTRASLRLGDQFARLIAENATLGLVMMDARQHCTYMNPAAERITGWTLEEVLALDKPLHDIIHHLHPDGRPYPISECPIDRALPTRMREQGEDVFVHRDGHLYPVAFTASPILENGVPVGTIIEVRDLTEERRQRQALRDSEEQYRFLAESIPVHVWTTRPDGAVDYINTRCAEFFGARAQDLRAGNWQSVLHPDDFGPTVAAWEHAIAQGAPYEAEVRLLDANGAYRWHLTRAVPLRDAAGRIVKWFGTNTNIDERRRIELERDRALAIAQAERARLHEVFQNAPAVIALYAGPDFRVEMHNPMWERFVRRENAVGRAFAELFPELVDTPIHDILRNVLRTAQPFTAREMHVPFDRSGTGTVEDTYWTFVLQPLRDADGKVESILAHAVEVTDEVRTRQEVERTANELARLTTALERTNRELDQFAYVASHDLKAPLRGIANLAQWIEEDLGEKVGDTSREHLQLLKGRVQRMDALIDGILRYSRAGRVKGPIERVDVGRLLAETIELLAPAEGSRVEVGAMPLVEAEKVQLQQVFMNLIGNALKHAGKNARVTVTSRDGDDAWEFAVQDDGPGIAPEFHERIWGIFQTLESRDRVEGTGIGLSVVRKIVETRGGRAWVESQPGQGATFRFTWPKQLDNR